MLLRMKVNGPLYDEGWDREIGYVTFLKNVPLEILPLFQNAGPGDARVQVLGENYLVPDLPSFVVGQDTITVKIHSSLSRAEQRIKEAFALTRVPDTQEFISPNFESLISEGWKMQSQCCLEKIDSLAIWDQNSSRVRIEPKPEKDEDVNG